MIIGVRKTDRPQIYNNPKCYNTKLYLASLRLLNSSKNVEILKYDNMQMSINALSTVTNIRTIETHLSRNFFVIFNEIV